MKKCESNGTKYASQLCDFLRKRAVTKAPHGRVKGLYKSDVVDTLTGEKQGTMVYYDAGKGDRLHVNSCPFCGGKLHNVDIE
ncbi:hypothetical protein [Xenorhabdus bovienii]|uniref:Uncharacterized protein n=1 Tax=Xenorhabdus bovienii str. Intermedium TaxID=1379677 RepID=A0A077QKP3_XENBV|nr:hypothetical protein [Xenorhabdus bovienii]CDH33753.1 conserved hypothetical protein [Xenorhabdus bovienii str. Intermedium]